MLKRILLILNILLLLLLSGGVQAESISADKVIVSTPKYRPELTNFKPSFGTYEYKTSWAGIPAATVYLSVEKDNHEYKINTLVETYRGISMFYRLKYEAKGVISSVNFRPISTEIYQKENSKEKLTEIKYSRNGTVTSSHKSGDSDPLEMEFNPNNIMLDPFSSAFIARSLDWKKGQTRYFDTFNGKSRYLISFSAVDKIKMEINDEDRDVWVIEPAVVKLTTDKKGSKLRKARIYITADESREIIKINSEVFIGSVNTKLQSFTPSNKGYKPTLAKAEVIKYDY